MVSKRFHSIIVVHAVHQSVENTINGMHLIFGTAPQKTNGNRHTQRCVKLHRRPLKQQVPDEIIPDFLSLSWLSPDDTAGGGQCDHGEEKSYCRVQSSLRRMAQI